MSCPYCLNPELTLDNNGFRDYYCYGEDHQYWYYEELDFISWHILHRKTDIIIDKHYLWCNKTGEVIYSFNKKLTKTQAASYLKKVVKNIALL